MIPGLVIGWDGMGWAELTKVEGQVTQAIHADYCAPGDAGPALSRLALSAIICSIRA